VETVEQSTVTTEQKACEQHFMTHTTQKHAGRFVVRLQQRWIKRNLKFLASLQREDYKPLNEDWNEI